MSKSYLEKSLKTPSNTLLCLILSKDVASLCEHLPLEDHIRWSLVSRYLLHHTYVRTTWSSAVEMTAQGELHDHQGCPRGVRNERVDETNALY